MHGLQWQQGENTENAISHTPGMTQCDITGSEAAAVEVDSHFINNEVSTNKILAHLKGAEFIGYLQPTPLIPLETWQSLRPNTSALQ